MVSEKFFKLFEEFWSYLDQIFTYIDNQFKSWFHIIPDSAIPYLIGIFIYSFLAYMEIFINMQKENNREGMHIFMNFYHAFLVLFGLLFSIWRMGIINQINPDLSSFNSLTDWVVNVVYIFFALILIVSFLKKISWLKNGLLIMLWGLFIGITFVVAPILEGFKPNNDTLMMVFWLAGLFLAPNVVVAVQNRREAREEKIK
jgi:hypothetical protein